MCLRDGTKKMSKSDPSDNSRINLTDDADAIAQKIRKAKTDPEPLPSEEKGLEAAPRSRQSGRHLCGAGGQEQSRGAGRFRRRAILDLQEFAGRACVAKLAPIAAEMKRLIADPGHIDAILVDGADGRGRSPPSHAQAEDIVGFVRKT